MSRQQEAADASRARHYRESDPVFAHWAAGYGVIRHSVQTQLQVHDLALRLQQRQLRPDTDGTFRLLAAADRVAAMACWLVGHLTYARHVRLDGSALGAADFKDDPQGHTGGSLNMVPAYVGYMAANALDGFTRGWLMGQGHCVAAIESVNVLLGNLSPEQSARYDWSDAGLTRMTQDFYAYRVQADGSPAALLGSHVNAYTGGGVIEGGYLGFAELQYAHMALPGERLVAFLSDGALEEQRGADWAARWWRQEDDGLVVPVLIANGRRIDQRTTLQQMGGIAAFEAHLRLNGFLPQRIDGTDPAAFACAILQSEDILRATAQALDAGLDQYPVALPYVIAEAPKGFGFPNAGSNLAHGTPLAANPRHDAESRRQFHAAVDRLWVPPHALEQARACFATHDARPRERDHAMANRRPPAPSCPPPEWRETGSRVSAMHALDDWLENFFGSNPHLRARVGNPDELHSNGLDKLLARLRHRVADPEPGNHEAVDGAIITALNEEAVACSALANKGGLNLIVSYEAFAVKMLGALRQEIIFAQHQTSAGRPPQWLSIPLLATSHAWENGKNEQSHQDPSLCEALLGEMCHVARVLFPPDANAALAALSSVYGSRGRIALMVVAKQPLPVWLDAAQARQLAVQGAVCLQADEAAQVELVAIGGHQLQEAMKAGQRLRDRGLPTRIVCLQEPARFRQPRDAHEAVAVASDAERDAVFSAHVRTRVFITHTRSDMIYGLLRRLDPGPAYSTVLGFLNHGGTLDTPGMLYANRCTWAHVVAEAARLQGRAPEDFLSAAEAAAVAGRGDPYAVIPPPHPRG
jgi:phosphoketolase